jgi:hypothetical protein
MKAGAAAFGGVTCAAIVVVCGLEYERGCKDEGEEGQVLVITASIIRRPGGCWRNENCAWSDEIVENLPCSGLSSSGSSGCVCAVEMKKK